MCIPYSEFKRIHDYNDEVLRQIKLQNDILEEQLKAISRSPKKGERRRTPQ